MCIGCIDGWQHFEFSFFQFLLKQFVQFLLQQSICVFLVFIRAIDLCVCVRVCACVCV